MGTYFDTSFLVGLFVDFDAFAESAKVIYIDADNPLFVSDFAAAECSSVIARLVRMKVVLEDDAGDIFSQFDAWLARSAQAASVAGTDVQTAMAFIRRLDLNIRAPDAINLAIAQRLGASVATFDHGMADNARAFGIAVA